MAARIHLLVASAVALAALTIAIPTQAAGGGAPKCFGKTATIVGTNGRDRIDATNQADVIVARGGNDMIQANEGKDRVCGGGGHEAVTAGEASDPPGGR